MYSREWVRSFPQSYCVFIEDLIVGANEGLFFGVSHNVDMGYDNSSAFAEFIKSQEIDNVLSETGLKIRQSHKVAPYVRIRRNSSLHWGTDMAVANWCPS